MSYGSTAPGVQVGPRGTPRWSEPEQPLRLSMTSESLGTTVEVGPPWSKSGLIGTSWKVTPVARVDLDAELGAFLGIDAI